MNWNQIKSLSSQNKSNNTSVSITMYYFQKQEKKGFRKWNINKRTGSCN